MNLILISLKLGKNLYFNGALSLIEERVELRDYSTNWEPMLCFIRFNKEKQGKIMIKAEIDKSN